MTTGDPAMASNDGRITVAVRGVDSNIWINSSSDAGTTWSSGWTKVGNMAFQSSPAISYHGLNNVEVSARTGDGLFHVASVNTQTGVASSWDAIPGLNFTFAPASAGHILASNGRYAVAGRRNDGRMWINVWE